MNLMECFKVARSAPDGVPTAKYIGMVERGRERYYLYQEQDKIFYETDFDREMRKLRRRSRR